MLGLPTAAINSDTWSDPVIKRVVRPLDSFFSLTVSAGCD